jgi:hypothetical protein
MTGVSSGRFLKQPARALAASSDPELASISVSRLRIDDLVGRKRICIPEEFLDGVRSRQCRRLWPIPDVF